MPKSKKEYVAELDVLIGPEAKDENSKIMTNISTLPEFAQLKSTATCFPATGAEQNRPLWHK
ncbi:hypothetical protein [Falsiphaeobacter marinintestinus]|uniref:hypothetical protein n=1 Tax=Falsiphaeobacter marinintestinus TaxID=1492905 RepID=UPI0011B500E6|nr:hypothetical protein [Phaeobacter marinintestinus]